METVTADLAQLSHLDSDMMVDHKACNGEGVPDKKSGLIIMRHDYLSGKTKTYETIVYQCLEGGEWIRTYKVLFVTLDTSLSRVNYRIYR